MDTLAYRSSNSAILCNKENVLPGVLNPPQLRYSRTKSLSTVAPGVLSPANFVRRYCLNTVLTSSGTEKSVNQMSTKSSSLPPVRRVSLRMFSTSLGLSAYGQPRTPFLRFCDLVQRKKNVLPNVLDPPQIRSSHAQSLWTKCPRWFYLLLTLCAAIHFVQFWDFLKHREVSIRMLTKKIPLLHAEFLCEFVAAIAMKILRFGFRKVASVGAAKGLEVLHIWYVPYVATCQH